MMSAFFILQTYIHIFGRQITMRYQARPDAFILHQVWGIAATISIAITKCWILDL